MHVGKFERGATGLHQLKGPRKKEDVFREQQAKLLLEEKMDLGVFQEVEGKESFLAFNEIYLNGQFDPLMVKGNDPRGIQIGMYLKHDLPFEIEYRSHVARTWVDPISQHKQRVFTRDLPTLIVRAKGDKKPLVVFIGTHYKSKRDRDDDPESEILRKAQADATVEIINALKRELGEAVPIILAGDFNGNYNKEEAFANMRKALDMDDPFNDLNVSNHDRVTHTYHPRDAETKWNQVDYLLVSRNIKACIKSAYVHRYKDAAGKIKPLPNTYEERKQNPSDHFPVVMQLDFQCLLKYWRNN